MESQGPESHTLRHERRNFERSQRMSFAASRRVLPWKHTPCSRHSKVWVYSWRSKQQRHTRSKTCATIAYPNIPLDDASHRVEDAPIIEFCVKRDRASYRKASRKVLIKVCCTQKTKMSRYSGQAKLGPNISAAGHITGVALCVRWETK